MRTGGDILSSGVHNSGYSLDVHTGVDILSKRIHSRITFLAYTGVETLSRGALRQQDTIVCEFCGDNTHNI